MTSLPPENAPQLGTCELFQHHLCHERAEWCVNWKPVAAPENQPRPKSVSILGMEPDSVLRQVVRTYFAVNPRDPALGQTITIDDVSAIAMEFNQWLVSTNETLQKVVMDKINTTLPSPILIEKTGEAQGEVPQPVKCLAQRSADPPQDCDWPFCGCDEKATKVIEALLECGWMPPKDQPEYLVGRVEPGAHPPPDERTDQDYAIEHGGYLANAAEFFQNSINEYARVRATADPDRDEELIDAARETQNDAWRGLSSAIYKFRKRAKRARAPQPVSSEKESSTWNMPATNAGLSSSPSNSSNAGTTGTISAPSASGSSIPNLRPTESPVASPTSSANCICIHGYASTCPIHGDPNAIVLVAPSKLSAQELAVELANHRVERLQKALRNGEEMYIAMRDRCARVELELARPDGLTVDGLLATLHKLGYDENGTCNACGHDACDCAALGDPKL